MKSAFRSQLVLEEQRKLFDVWCQAATGADLPSRSQIQLRCFGALLPFVSLIEQDSCRRLMVRMTGSSLRDVFGDDPNAALQCNACPSATAAIRETFDTGLPQAGSCARTSAHGQGLRFWLRLPLGTGPTVDAVLGLDISLAARRAPQWALEQMAAHAGQIA